jgi:hypothetical protein
VGGKKEKHEGEEWEVFLKVHGELRWINDEFCCEMVEIERKIQKLSSKDVDDDFLTAENETIESISEK